MQDADLVFYVKLELKPECVDEWKAAVFAVIEHMSREPAFVSCALPQCCATFSSGERRGQI